MKSLLLGLALCIPFHLVAAEDDSVHSWGDWAEGIKPAAGAVVSITPAPVEPPRVNFRPNENSAFSRTLQLPAGNQLPNLPAVTPDSVQFPQVQVPIEQANTDPRTGRGR